MLAKNVKRKLVWEPEGAVERAEQLKRSSGPDWFCGARFRLCLVTSFSNLFPKRRMEGSRGAGS